MTLVELFDGIGKLLEEFLDNPGVPIKKEEEVQPLCGSLKHSHWTSKAPIKIGEVLPAGTKIMYNDGSLAEGDSVWNGFAREETLDGWQEKGWVAGTLEVDGYTEGGQDFSVPKGEVIQVLTLKKDRNYVNIITRPPQNKIESSVHGRWPKTIKKEE